MRSRAPIVLAVALALAACEPDPPPPDAATDTAPGDASPDTRDASTDTRDTSPTDADAPSDADTRPRDTATTDTTAPSDAPTDTGSDGDLATDTTDASDARADSGADGDAAAAPAKDIRIKLTWDNPEDPDETDAEGSDLDLQMVKMGPGNWFESPYAVYFRNPNDSGAPIWNPEAPSLTASADDGAGPEVIEMAKPQPCEWYAIGVHYYEQRFGTAYATVRVFVDGNLVHEQINKPLQQGGAFWDVARLHARSYDVVKVDDKRATPPTNQSPTVTNAMQNSGRCTARNLY